MEEGSWHQVFKKGVRIINDRWDNLEDIYQKPEFVWGKGTRIALEMSIDQELDTYDKETMGNFINSWTYPQENRDIRPFKLISFVTYKNNLSAEIIIIIKNPDVDEFKLLFQDLLHYFNYFKIHVTSFKVKLV